MWTNILARFRRDWRKKWKEHEVCVRYEFGSILDENAITIASPQIYSRHPVKVKVVTVHRNGQPPLGVAASRL